MPLHSLQTRLDTKSCLVLVLELFEQLGILFFQGFESLLDLEARVGFSLDLIMRVPNPLLGDVNLLGHLHISNTKSHEEYIHVRINTHLNV